MTDRNKTPKLRERMLSEARQHSSDHNLSFRDSLDRSARTRGFDDWAHFEHLDSDRNSIPLQMTMASVILGRSLPSSQWPPVSRILGRVAARLGFLKDMPIPARRALLPAACVASLASVVMFTGVFLDADRIQTTGIAGIFDSFVAIAMTTGTRTLAAASRHPDHRIVPLAISMNIYLLGFSMPLLSGFGLLLARPPVSDNPMLLGALWASLAAGPLWLLASADVLLRHQESAR